MNYILVGINHKTAPVRIRENLALNKNQSLDTLSRILSSAVIQEATVLSTCNRVEFYGSTNNPEIAKTRLIRTMLLPFNGHGRDLQNFFYVKKDKEAVSHLFEVTASLDSQITGENQITSQVKEAHSMALEQAASGTYLNTLFHRALHVAKRVRSETQIGKGQVSVGSVAVLLAKRIFGSLVDKSVLLIGAGETGELVVRHLNAENVKETFIINRSPERAQRLEDMGLGKACSSQDLRDLLKGIDVIITSASETITDLDKENLRDVMIKRYQQPLFIIDLGVPRNIPADITDISNIYLYNLDDLDEIAEENRNNRALSLKEAKNIIDNEVHQFYEKHVNSLALPAIASLGKKIEHIRQQEFKKTISKMSHLDPKDLNQIDKLTQSIVGKILHDPILSIKNQAAGTGPGMLNFFKKIFRLDDEGD